MIFGILIPIFFIPCAHSFIKYVQYFIKENITRTNVLFYPDYVKYKDIKSCQIIYNTLESPKIQG